MMKLGDFDTVAKLRGELVLIDTALAPPARQAYDSQWLLVRNDIDRYDGKQMARKELPMDEDSAKAHLNFRRAQVVDALIRLGVLAD